MSRDTIFSTALSGDDFETLPTLPLISEMRTLSDRPARRPMYAINVLLIRNCFLPKNDIYAECTNLGYTLEQGLRHVIAAGTG